MAFPNPAIKARPIPRISLHDYAVRKDEIGRQIIDAAENTGFFVLVNQESPSAAEIEEVFSVASARPPSVRIRCAGAECR